MAIQYLSVYNRRSDSFSESELDAVYSDMALSVDSFRVREFRAVIRREFSERKKEIATAEREQAVLETLNRSPILVVVYTGDWRFLSTYRSHCPMVQVIEGQSVFVIRREMFSRLPAKFFKIFIK